MEEADRCPYCGLILHWPPECCIPMQEEYSKELALDKCAGCGYSESQCLCCWE